jgi:chromosome segregation ATPase
MESSIKDYIEAANAQFKKIPPLLNAWSASSLAEKKGLQIKIETSLKSANSYIGNIKMEIEGLTDENLEKKYRDELQKLKQEYKKLSDDFQNKKNDTNTLNFGDIELMEKPIDKMNVQEAFDHGDQRVKDSGQVINNIQKNVRECNDQAVLIKQELDKQNEQLGVIQGELSEIDESLKRSNKTMRQILRGLATDKFILCMIVVIVLVIIAIIIVAAVGGDPNNSFNVPHDLFGPKKATNVTSS